jgi:hypothetical protein
MNKKAFMAATVICTFVILLSGIQSSCAVPDTWTAKKPMTYTFSERGSPAVLNGTIYVVRSGHLLIYLVNNDTWAEKATNPVGSLYNSLAACDGKIYDFTDMGNQVYDPSNDSWAPIAAMPTPRTYFTANIVDGKIYVVSGAVLGFYSANFSASNWVYDPANDTWSSMPPIPTAVSNHASAVVDGKIYIIGGVYHYDYPNEKFCRIVQVFDPLTNQWSRGAPMPTDMALISAVSFVGSDLKERICVVGGAVDWSRWTGYKNVNWTQIYDPESGNWSTEASLSEALNGVYLANVDNKVYALGGENYNGVWVNMNEEYTLPDYGRPLSASLAESASSLYFGNAINFTVTADGGKEPYTYSWNVDNQTVENVSSPYFSLDNLTIGEHHVFAAVTDADNNTATTLTVAFDVLPNPNLSPTPTLPKPTPSLPYPPTPSPSVAEFPNWTILPLVGVVAIMLVYFLKRRKL